MKTHSNLCADPVCLGLTRPATKWGVPYLALLGELVLCPLLVLGFDDLSLAVLAAPVHGLLVVIYRFQPRAFDVLRAWVIVKLAVPASVGRRVWSVGPDTCRPYGRRWSKS